MKKLLLPISVGCLSVSFTYSPSTTLHNSNPVTAFHSPISDSRSHFTDAAAILLYESTGLEQYGLSKQAFDYAWRGYQRLLEKKMITHSRYLTICDFSQSSKKKRLYIIDIASEELITNTYVAHGRNSGGEYATKFSNTPESLQSSLGFYITQNTYIGAHGLSLRLEGVDGQFNSKAFARSIVIHGAAYVDESRVRTGGYMGRSWGCPALPQKEATSIITTIKGGSCLFIYHPAKNYLAGSTILNG